MRKKILYFILFLVFVLGCEKNNTSTSSIQPIPSESIVYIDPPNLAEVEGRVYVQMEMPYEFDEVREVYVYADGVQLQSDVYFIYGDLSHWFFQSIGFSGPTTIQTQVLLNNGAIGSNDIVYNVIHREVLRYEESYDFIYESNILCSDVDSENNLWFGTTNGLIRYNGEVFEQIDFAGEVVADLKIDLNDKIWMLITPNQIASYKDGVINTFTAVDGDEEAEIQPYKDRLAVNDGSVIYFTESKQLWRFNSTEFDSYEYYDVTHLGMEPDNDLWFIVSGWNWYLNHFSGNNVIYSEEILHHSSSYSGIDDLRGDIIIDENNVKWFNIYNYLYKYDNTLEVVIRVRFGESDSWAYGIGFDSEGYTWLGTHKQGLQKIYNQSVFEYNETNCFIQSLPDRKCVPIQSVTIDLDDDIWICIGDNEFTDYGQIIQIKKLN